jgi:hypothetical protein
VVNDAIGLDDVFRTFLDDVGATKPSPDFDEWLTDKLDSGAYEIAEEY